MRKTFILICSVFILIIFCSCQQSKVSVNQSVQNNTSKESTPVNIDYSAAVPAKQANTVRYTESSLSIATEPIKNETEMFKVSPVVIHGKVMKSDYLLKGSEVYTKSEVQVLECYKGDLKEGQVIKIREIGGFVPSDVYDDALSMEKFGEKSISSKSKQTIYDIRVRDNKVMEVGEDVILFVYPIDYSDFKEFQTNSYQLVRVWQGKLLFDESKGIYSPYIPKEELSFVEARSYTLDEFKAVAKSCAK